MQLESSFLAGITWAFTTYCQLTHRASDHELEVILSIEYVKGYLATLERLDNLAEVNVNIPFSDVYLHLGSVEATTGNLVLPHTRGTQITIVTLVILSVVLHVKAEGST